MVKKLYISLVMTFMTFAVYSQSIISYVTVYPNDVYIGQPAQLKVTVLTSTWFTDGIDIGNIQVDGALTVFFRSVSTSKTINNKRYSGVDFYYNVFPTQEGVLKIPVLEIHVESPKDGGYKGIKRTTKTKIKNLTVKNIPLGYDPQNWLVATGLNVREKWSTSLKDIKVGDVLQRTITRSVSGTLSEFIPATTWDSINGVSIYPNRARINTNKSKTGVSASRSETVNYLFEKEGGIIIPTIQYLYWNSYNNRFYRKQIDSIRIQVKPNANLAMLASLKKSLQKENIEEVQADENPILILGLKPLDFVKYVLFGLFALFILLKIIKRLIRFVKIKYDNYVSSEVYIFMKVKKAIIKNDYFLFLKLTPVWLHFLHTENNSLTEMANYYGSKSLKEVLDEINERTFYLQKPVEPHYYKQLLKEIKLIRKNYFKKHRSKGKSKEQNSKWLNPTTPV